MTEVFQWNRLGLNRSHFHSFANLLSLHNGGQTEPAALFDTVLEQDWEVHDEEEDDSLSLDTALVNQLSNSGLVDGRKGSERPGCIRGKAVTCSAMKAAEDEAIFWLARNNGFSGEDQYVFERLEMLLGKLSCNNGEFVWSASLSPRY
jgi:hypothetical protein